GPQAYVNPYAYVPFYALVSSGLSALQIASLLAVAHSAILWLTYELALAVFPSGSSASRAVFAICAVALAAVNPVLIQQIGSSLAEALWRPFAMLDPVPMVHEELRAPDLRYAVLSVLLCALVMQWLWTRLTPARPSARAAPPLDLRVLAALGCGFTVDWLLWL